MRKKEGKISIFILLILSIVFLFPLILTFSNSFMSKNEILLNYSDKISVFDIIEGVKKSYINFKLIPEKFTLAQYEAVLINQPSFLILLLNSVKITFPIVIGNIIVSLITAYGFTIWKFKYKEVVYFIYIVVMLLPVQATLVPNYIIADTLNINKSYLAIILPGIFSPFGTFLLRQNLKTVPEDYFEAARIDGANEWKIFLHVILPQLKSGIGALFMLLFIEYWNIIEQVLIFVKDYFREPLSVYLSRITENNIELFFAISCIYMFLPFYFLIIGQSNLEKGIELSGVK